jgi:hypothetical protein
MDGLTVLVEAKKEYLAQLCTVLCPHMIETFETLYAESNTISKGKKVLVQYQKLLKEVPNWNNHMIHQHSERICNSCGWFNDLLAAVFVSYVKILSSVRLNSENKKISIKLPSNDVFIHGCYTNAAKDIYKDPFVYHDELSEYERDEILTRRFINCIETTVKEMIPVQQILKAYIAHSGDLEVGKTEELDTEDPEIEEEPFPEELPQEPLPQEVVPQEVPLPVPAAFPPEVSQEVVPQEEVKEVNLGVSPPDDVLFPDAKE